MKEEKDLLDIESRMVILYEARGLGFLEEDTRHEVKYLENKRRFFLENKENKEDEWRMKSRVLWLARGMRIKNISIILSIIRNP